VVRGARRFLLPHQWRCIRIWIYCCKEANR